MIPRPPKKVAPPLPNWRTTLGHSFAIMQYLAAHKKMSYGEFMRQATSFFLTGNKHHDFDSDQMVISPADSVFADSQFDQNSRV